MKKSKKDLKIPFIKLMKAAGMLGNPNNVTKTS